MKVVMNEKSLIGIKENGRVRLLRNYKEFEAVTIIQVGKEDLKITGRLAIAESDGKSRMNLTLENYQNQTYKASLVPMFDGQNTFLKFGNKEQTNPSLFLMQILPKAHLLSDTEKEQLRKALDRELSASEQDEKEITELYQEWYVNQVTIQRRSPSKIESKSEWFETVYQSVMEEMEVKEVLAKEVVNA